MSFKKTSKRCITFFRCQLNDAVTFPEGVCGAVVVLFGLGVDMNLHRRGNALPVDDLHNEADGLPSNGSLFQVEGDRNAPC